MAWRSRSPVRKRTNPAGFIVPCAPTLADRPPSGPGWIHEIKFDGWRMVARKSGAEVRLWTRSGADVTDRFGRIRAAVAVLRADSAVLDGEAICDSFHSLKGSGAALAELATFDLVELDGEDLRRSPIEVRKLRLAGLLGKGIDGISICQHIEEDGPRVFDHACRLGCEGIVSKRLGSGYVSGRSRNWIKSLSPSYQRG